MRWLVCPWFDEGDEWPESQGSYAVITAESKQDAIEVYDGRWGPFSGLAWYAATPETDWREHHQQSAEAVAILRPDHIVDAP